MLSSDTIAAVSSPPGPGIRGVVRVSGPLAFSALEDLAGTAIVRNRGAAHARLAVSGLPAVPARLWCFVAPSSYTGEDVVEAHVPGVPVLLDALLAELFLHGVRPAGPGEFTARALHSGRISLSRAEGVAALIAAEDESDRRAAVAWLTGERERDLADIAGHLADLAALVELGIDFTDQDIELIPVDEIERRTRDALQRLAGFPRSEHRRPAASSLFRALIAGPANAGKSSLFNALLGRERALVSDEPGATRDIIEEPVRWNGVSILLADCAGFLETATEVQHAAEVLREQALAGADLILWACSADQPPMPVPDRVDPRRVLRVLTKADLSLDPAPPGVGAVTSARRSLGIESLRRRIAHFALRATRGSGVAMPGHTLSGARRARRALEDLLDSGDARRPELAAALLRDAIRALENVTGQVTADDVLQRVFAGFCVGK